MFGIPQLVNSLFAFRLFLTNDSADEPSTVDTAVLLIH